VCRGRGCVGGAGVSGARVCRGRGCVGGAGVSGARVWGVGKSGCRGGWVPGIGSVTQVDKWSEVGRCRRDREVGDLIRGGAAAQKFFLHASEVGA
jgi:hypothetical protein